MRFAILIPVVLLAFSCTKEIEQTPVNSTADTISLNLASRLNAIDSFDIQVNGAWNITSSVDWFVLSATSGTGNSKIYVTTTRANNGAADRSATIVVTSNSLPALSVNVTQSKYIFSPWSKTLGTGFFDEFKSVTAATDGGYIAVGSKFITPGTLATVNSQLWIVKFDAAGNTEWEKLYGADKYDGGQQILKVDGGYVIRGVTETNDTMTYVPFISKIDENGTIVWTKHYNITDDTELRSLVAVPSGGFICTGSINYDAILLRLTDEGETTWIKTFSTAGRDFLNSVVPTTDNGFMAVGNRDYPGGGDMSLYDSQDVWLIKTDASGNIVWENNYGGSSADWASNIVATADGGALIQAITWGSTDIPDYHSLDDIVLIKIDVNGNKQWIKAIGSSAYDYCYAIKPVQDGFLLLSPYGVLDNGANETFGMRDIYLVKVDNTGNIVSQKAFGGIGSDGFDDLIVLNDKVVLVGESSGTSVDVGINGEGVDGWISAINLP